MKASPASRAIRELDNWQIGLIYDMAMNYPIEGLRRAYYEDKKSVSNFSDADLSDPDMGYTPEEISKIKGGR